MTARNSMLIKGLIALTIIALGCVGFATDAFSETYYVSNSGSDGASGLSGSPWRTAQHAAGMAQPGDIVLFANGTYQGFYSVRSGTVSQPITFRGQSDNAYFDTENSATSDIINIEDTDYIVLDNLVVAWGNRAGIRLVESRGCVIQNCTSGPNEMWGILTGFAPESRLLNNTCFDSNQQHGIYVSNSRVANDAYVVRGNECYGNGQNGIQFNGDCGVAGDGQLSNNLIEGNYVHDNHWKGLSLISMDNSVVRNNILWNNGLSSGAGGIHLTDEPGCNLPSDDNLVVNNTIYETNVAGIRLTDGVSGNVIFNNLVIASSQSETIVDEVGGNSIDAASNLRLTSTSGLFVNVGGDDYHLAQGSSAIGAGVASYSGRNAPSTDADGTARPQDGTYDVGAFEYGGSPPPPDDTVDPQVSITNPVSGVTVDGTIDVAASATDNVGVAGVQFQIDGSNLGSEDSSPPYQVSLNTTGYTNGTYILTAVARDAAGNSATSSPVQITINNSTPPPTDGIRQGRARLWLTTERLAELRQKACLDANGNPIPGCTPTDDWVEYRSWVDGGDAYGDQAWHYALLYVITRETGYRTTAINMMMSEAGGMSQERFDSYLDIGEIFRSQAMTFDWLYNDLTTTQRATMINYFNQIVTEIWNPFNNPYNTWSGWAVEDPGNNYYYNFLVGTCYAAIATYYENQATLSLPFRGTDYDNMLEFVYAKIDNQSIPEWLETRGEGGGWHEGTSYRMTALNHMFEMWSILKDAGGVNYYEQVNFAQEHCYFQIYITQPGNEVEYPGGDLARESSMSISSFDRQLMLLFADGIVGAEARYAQDWVNTTPISPAFDFGLMRPMLYLLYHPGNAATDYKSLPLAYYAKGLGFVNSRSGWGSNDMSFSLICTDHLQSHQHMDQNSFVIYRDDWLATDTGTYSSSGLIQQTSGHNTILVNGNGQSEGSQADIIKYERNSPHTYTYMVGDAAGAYNRLSTFQREAVHVLPDVVVIYDRITPNSAGDNIEYLLHVRNAPTIQGNQIIATQGNGKLFHQTLLPADYTFNNVSDLGRRIEISSATTHANWQFLNVMYVTDASASIMPTVTHRTAGGGVMTGAQIGDGSSRTVIMFSTDPGGASPGGEILLDIGFDTQGLHRWFDLKPDTYYDVEVAESGAGRMVIVREGEQIKTSSQGVLEFDLREIILRDCELASK